MTRSRTLFIILSTLAFLSDSVFGGEWTEEGKFTYFLLDVGMNSKTGAYAAAAANGVGSMILKSTDLGKTWIQEAERDGFLDIGCGSNSNDSAVVTGILGEGYYTLDGGNTFRETVGFIPGVQAIAKSRVDKQYGAPGGAGMSVSSDYGATWTHHKASNVNASRYGSLPSENTWYITAGIWFEPTTQFPMKHDNGNTGITNVIKLTSKIKLYWDSVNNIYIPNIATKEFNDILFIEQEQEEKLAINNKPHKKKQHRKKVNVAHEKPQPKNLAKLSRGGRRSLQQNDLIWGEIWKTTDAGATWTVSYSNSGEFYFNAIDCCDENTCYAVAEGDTEAGSDSPGARIFGTTDGNTWTQLYYDNNDAASLMTVHCISDNEAWAGGGTIASGDFDGTFLYTDDGGKTWTTNTVSDPVLFMDMTNDGKYGIATGLTRASLGVVYGFE